jgi:hypothetical protein
MISDAINGLKFWSENIENLIKEQWPYDTNKPWRGAPVNLTKVLKIMERLTEFETI